MQRKKLSDAQISSKEKIETNQMEIYNSEQKNRNIISQQINPESNINKREKELDEREDKLNKREKQLNMRENVLNKREEEDIATDMKLIVKDNSKKEKKIDSQRSDIENKESIEIKVDDCGKEKKNKNKNKNT